MPDEVEQPALLKLTSRIVAAHLSKNGVQSGDLPDLIKSVYEALAAAVASEPTPLKPAVPIKKSVTQTYLVCLEDGKMFKLLKQHLRAVHSVTPGEYCAKWPTLGLSDSSARLCQAAQRTR